MQHCISCSVRSGEHYSLRTPAQALSLHDITQEIVYERLCLRTASVGNRSVVTPCCSLILRTRTLTKQAHLEGSRTPFTASKHSTHDWNCCVRLMRIGRRSKQRAPGASTCLPNHPRNVSASARRARRMGHCRPHSCTPHGAQHPRHLEGRKNHREEQHAQRQGGAVAQSNLMFRKN